MDNIAGPPVEGDNFFGREADINTLRELLEHHDLLLLGPRRIGKTSIARALMRVMREAGWRVVEINVATCDDERAFVEKLETALRQETASLGDKLWDSVGTSLNAIRARIQVIRIPVPGAGSLGVELRAAPTKDWATVASELVALIAGLDQRWLIYVDELPIMLLTRIIRGDPTTGVERVRRFLDWFRNDVRGLPGAARVRWLVSGSIGLDTLVQQHAMADTINTLRQVTLPPFSEPEVIAMLDRLGARYGLALAAADATALLAGIQWLQPYYVQLAFSELRGLLAAQPGAAPGTLIDATIEQVAQSAAYNDFHHWEKRLADQLAPATAGHARALLGQAAATREGARVELLLATLAERLPNATAEEVQRLFVDLRDILLRDGYWGANEDAEGRRYRFLLEPLRRWWLRRNTP
ncbi:MAG: ATP-binding protein [Candidatus Contendobacter sp.]|nr:ATP-binding protein [Candidatus Contendobacter sp.]